MNKVYESPTMVVHDDREPITAAQAVELLWEGKSVLICYPPDYSAEEESDIFDRDYPIYINDILSWEEAEKQSREKSEKAIYDYLRGYEIYR